MIGPLVYLAGVGAIVMQMNKSDSKEERTELRKLFGKPHNIQLSEKKIMFFFRLWDEN